MTRPSVLACVLVLSLAPGVALAQATDDSLPLASYPMRSAASPVAPFEVVDATAPPVEMLAPLGRYTNWMVSDVTGFFTNARPLHAVAVAGVGGILALGSLTDVELSEEAQEQYTGAAAPVFDAVNELGGRYALPGVAAFWGVTMLTSDTRLQDAAFTSLEAGIYAATITGALKATVGRVRPIDGSDPYDFHPFSGNTSFPSGHTTLAFALTVPWAVYYPGSATYALVGLAGGTAVARIVLTSHWPTDVVGGALIGGLTGYILAHRHLRLGEAPDAPMLSASPLALPGGAGVTLRLQF